MRFEVREITGTPRYSGPDKALAKSIYDKYAATGAAVSLVEISVVEETPEYTKQRELLRGVTPWVQ
jgi:hypothetical protein